MEKDSHRTFNRESQGVTNMCGGSKGTVQTFHIGFQLKSVFESRICVAEELYRLIQKGL